MAVREIATLGGGCFWCLEAVYDELDGVLSVESGYMGGNVVNPTYKAVCTGKTGHVEVVQVTFDPMVIGYRDILEVFFLIHDPTTRDCQGNDVGPQYRSVIFYHDDHQRSAAEECIGEMAATRAGRPPIVTEVRPASTFYQAENYHQEYFRRNAEEPYCMYVVAPKLQHFRERFVARARKERRQA